MKIYIARHGQTEWNKLNKICGLTDVDLTALGREQAGKLAEDLKDKNISVIISSPLKRAMDTAGYVSGETGAVYSVRVRARVILRKIRSCQ